MKIDSMLLFENWKKSITCSNSDESEFVLTVSLVLQFERDDQLMQQTTLARIERRNGCNIATFQF